MFADVSTEPMISIAQAIALLPPGRGSERVHPSTVLRWILRGVRGPGGRRVRLAACRVGGRWLTSKESLGRFAAALTPDFATADNPATRILTPAKRRRAAEQANLELDKLGI